MRVLVVYKEPFPEASALDIRSRRIRRAVDAVTSHLERLGIRYDTVMRSHPSGPRAYGLVVSIGGDGTFFQAARHAGGTPILGINPDPAHSLGLWTGAVAASFRGPLERALAGKLRVLMLHRMDLRINGKRHRERPVNDLLFAHRNPASMLGYGLAVAGRVEKQRSSGVWIATAAGSTAGIRSSGGRRMPLASRRFQYLVREPYPWPRPCRLLHGTVGRLALVPHSSEAALWVDGCRVRIDLRRDDRVEIRPGEPLRVLGYDDARRRTLFP